MKPSKRIIFTVSNDLSYDQRMDRICTTLAQHRYQITLVGRKRKNSKSLVGKIYKLKRIKCFFERGKLFYLEFNIKLLFYLLFNNYHIACGVDLDTILPVYLSSKIRRKTWILDSHELFTEVPELNSRPKERKVWETMERFIFKRLTHGYTVSKSVASELNIRHGKKLAVIRNLPIQKFHLPSFNDSAKLIIYRGAVNEGRGLEEVIMAMKNVDATLLIAGFGDIYRDLISLVRNMNLVNKVKFTGYLSPEELDEATKDAYIGINLLTKSSLSYYYSLANKFFDYLQLGIPQLCMNYPEYAELNTKYNVAYLVDELSVIEITQKLNDLLNNKEHHTILSKNCLSAREELNWEKEEKKLIDFYRNL